jgi:hypothetical protein
MKMKSCVHWNYGYYGPKKGCMINKVCGYDCPNYMRRSTARKMRTDHNKIIKKKDIPVGESKGFFRSDECKHLLIEKVDNITILSCTAGPQIKIIDSCPKQCPYRRTE